jgi:hypothetical protein
MSHEKFIKLLDDYYNGKDLGIREQRAVQRFLIQTIARMRNKIPKVYKEPSN